MILRPLGWLYGIALGARNLLYDAGLLTVHKVRVPVISVGNMTAGGTGKTSFVEYLLRSLSGGGRKPAVISRGYGRRTRGTVVVSDGVSLKVTPEESGDEAFQIARKFPSAVVIVDEKRARGAALAAERFGAGVILLDDAFQHRSLARSLDIVMVNGDEPLEKVPLLPAGMRREPLRGLRRASLVVVSRPERPVPQVFVQSMRKPVVITETVVEAFCVPKGQRTLDAAEVRGKACVAFCGIGNPASFRRTLGKAGVGPLEFISFGDHHRYSMKDLEHIAGVFGKSGAPLLITTEKDAVRILPEVHFRGTLEEESMAIPETFLSEAFCYVAVRTAVLEGEGELQAMLRKVAG